MAGCCYRKKIIVSNLASSVEEEHSKPYMREKMVSFKLYEPLSPGEEHCPNSS